MKKFIEFINKEFFITDNIKFSIVTIILVSLIFFTTYFLLKLTKKIATKKLDEERKLKFKSVFYFFKLFCLHNCSSNYISKFRNQSYRNICCLSCFISRYWSSSSDFFSRYNFRNINFSRSNCSCRRYY